MVYLTLYEEYPIYEPAEGGYYYAGQQVDGFYRLNSEKQAKRKLAKLRKELEREGFVVIPERGYAYRSSKYIGEGAEIRIEKKLGQHESGWHPYE
jgi:hypothetical protein